MNLKYPKELVVGFQDRKETMVNMLAYITYKEKGKLRKEKSFEGWRSKEIPLMEMKNVPKSGFLISKTVRRDVYHFGTGRSMMRIYDPDGFDFEITIDNLEYILQNCNVNKGEIEGEFIYTWNGKELLLIPVDSQLYRDTIQFNKDLNEKIKTSDLKLAAVYKDKKSDTTYTYLGRHDFYRLLMDKELLEIKEKMNKTYGQSGRFYRTNYIYRDDFIFSEDVINEPKKQHVFFNNEMNKFEVNVTSKLAYLINDEDENYPNILENFKTSKHGSPRELISFTKLNEFKDKENVYEKIEKAVNKSIREKCTNLNNLEQLYIPLKNNYTIAMKIVWAYPSNLFRLCVDAICKLDTEKNILINTSIDDLLIDKNPHDRFYFSFNDKKSTMKSFKKAIKNLDSVLDIFEKEDKYIVKNITSSNSWLDFHEGKHPNMCFMDLFIYKTLGLKDFESKDSKSLDATNYLSKEELFDAIKKLDLYLLNESTLNKKISE